MELIRNYKKKKKNTEWFHVDVIIFIMRICDDLQEAKHTKKNEDVTK